MAKIVFAKLDQARRLAADFMSVQGIVLWMTGMSGVGKSTLSFHLARELKFRKLRSLVLDGDQVRKKLHRHLTFSKEDILENNRLVAELCAKNIPEYDVILVPIISPYLEGRNNARKIIGDAYREVYINASLSELVRRDTKGLYQKAIKGELKNLIGYSDESPYEKPDCPDLEIITDNASSEECVRKLATYLFRWLEGKSPR